MRTTALLALMIQFVLSGLAEAQTKFTWQFGKEYVVNYKQGTVSIGTEKVTFVACLLQFHFKVLDGSFFARVFFWIVHNRVLRI